MRPESPAFLWDAREAALKAASVAHRVGFVSKPVSRAPAERWG